MSTAYWCERAWVGDDVAEGVVISVADGTITDVATGVAAAPSGATSLAGVTLPGFANAHSHAFHRALRGRTHGGGGTFWTWREQMYRLAATLDPTAYEELATATFAEMVLCGYTAVGEFHYLHRDVDGRSYSDPNEVGRALLRAAARAGIRITLLDTCYLHGGIGEPATGAQRRFSDGSVDAWVARIGSLMSAVDTPNARVGAAIHSVRAVDPESAETVAKWAATNGAVLHAHVSEQPAENDACRAAYGGSPTEVLAGAGVFDARFTAVHATHAGEYDVELLARADASVCMCPTTERDLADGIGPSAALHARGGELCVGSDSHAVIDPFEETRAIELDERLASRTRGTHQPAELLAAATASGYRSLGWPGGSIAPGSVADLVTVTLDSPRLAGADPADLDAFAGSLVFAATAADVTDVIVAGVPVVRGGAHATIDVAACLRSSISAVWEAT